jgi:hypothetical protein
MNTFVPQRTQIERREASARSVIVMARVSPSYLRLLAAKIAAATTGAACASWHERQWQ